MRARRFVAWSAVLSAVAILSPAVLLQERPAPAVDARTWLGRHQEFEDFIRTAKTVGRMERIPVGVTGPGKVALEPGGPVGFIAWKPIRPGYYGEFFESYKAEIAAYEIDKLLGLDMVPPTVEKRIDGETGAAIAWVSGVKTFAELGGEVKAPAPHAERWHLQLVRAMMFDNLIGNEDPNLGNWLVDEGWNLVLIDHSRALRGRRDLYHRLNHVERTLWDRMKRLDDAALTPVLRTWLSRSEIKAILDRRERMQQAIDKLVQEKGEAQVFVGPKG